MKDGAVEQCDTPDQIVLHPATEYVRKFTEDIDKSRVVHASVLAQPDLSGTGEPVDAGLTVHKMAQILVQDTREAIPVVNAMVRRSARSSGPMRWKSLWGRPDGGQRRPIQPPPGNLPARARR